MRRFKERSIQVFGHDRGWLTLTVIWPWLIFLPSILRNIPLASGDYLRQYYLWESFFVNATRHGSWPWWNPYIFSGTPWFANPQSAMLFPIHWLALPFGPGQLSFMIFQCLVVSILAGGGVGIFFLVRRLVHSGSIAWWAAALWTTGTYLTYTLVDSVTATSVISCLPWGLWAVHGWVTSRRYRWLVAVMATGAIAWFAGFPSLFIVYCLGVWVAWIFLAWQYRSLRTDWWVMVVVTLGWLGLAGIQLFSALEFLGATERFTNAHAAVNSSLSLFPLMKGLLVFESGVPYWYLGLVPILLVIISMVDDRRKRPARWIVGWTTVMLTIFIGLKLAAPILEQYPVIYNLIRFTDRWLILPFLGLLLLAAIGFSSLPDRLIETGHRRLAITLSGIVGFLFVLIVGQPVDIVSGVVGLAVTGLLVTRGSIRKDRRIIVVLIIACLGPSGTLLLKSTAEMDYTTAVQDSRNWPMVAKEYSGSGWDSLILQQYTAVNPDANRLSLPAISASGALAWFPQDITMVPTETMASVVAAHRTSLAERSYSDLVNRLPAAGGRVHPVKASPNRFDFTTTSSSVGTLIFSQNFYPGWRATVDDSSTDIVRVNGYMQAIVIPAGTHQVRFSFAPRWFVPGLATSIGTIILIIVAGWLFRQRQPSGVTHQGSDNGVVV